MATVSNGDEVVDERYAVSGMTCLACVGWVEAALRAVPGVRSAEVDLRSAAATVRRDPRVASRETLGKAVQAAGYTLGGPTSAGRAHLSVRPLAFGSLAAAGLLGFYLGAIALAQGWGHAVEQLAADRWFVGALSLGFGVQVALFTYLRGRHATASAGGVAASTGTSATAMLACCAHHLTEVLPVLGISGAAAFLGAYKMPLLWLGIAMNLGGLAYLLWQIRWQRRLACQASVPDAGTR